MAGDPDLNSFSKLLQYLDTEVLVALWSKTFEGFGSHGSKVIRDEGTLAWICERLRSASDRPASDVAGVALYLIVSKHPFMDCNHRTGWLLAQTIMELGGFELVRPTSEVVAFVRAIDIEELSEETVKEWVARSFLRLG